MRATLFILLSLFVSFLGDVQSAAIRDRLHRVAHRDKRAASSSSEEQKMEREQILLQSAKERQVNLIRARAADRLDTEWDDLVDNNNDARFGFAEENNSDNSDDTKMAFREKGITTLAIASTIAAVSLSTFSCKNAAGASQSDPCVPNPCNSGVCSNANSINGGICSVTCACINNFMGTRCQVAYPMDWDFGTGTVSGGILDTACTGNTNCFGHVPFPVSKYSSWAGGTGADRWGYIHLNSRLSLPVDLSVSAMPTLSIAMWVNPQSNTNNRAWIVGTDDPAGGFDRAVMLFDNRFGGVSFGVGYQYASTLGYPEIGKWTFIVGTWKNGQACTMYRDDKQQVVNVNNGPSLATTDVGGLSSWASHEADALLSRLTIFNRILGPSDVKALYERDKHFYFPDPCSKNNCGGRDCKVTGLTYTCVCLANQDYDSSKGCVASNNVISNYGFELPYVGPNLFLSTSPTGWTSSSTGTAIDTTIPSMPQGRQCLSLTGKSSVSQSFTTTNAVGVFRVDISAQNKASGKQQEVGFFIDGVQAGSLKALIGGKWAVYSSLPKKLAQGAHTLELRALTDGDATVYLDRVMLTPAPNPCSVNPCDPNAACVDLNDSTGSVRCTCNTGYQGNGQSCAVVNPCIPNPCSPQASCAMSSSNPPKPVCTCISPGYAGDGKTCNEVDPCASATLNPCDKANGVCTKRGPGVATCTCKPGYAITPGTNACSASDFCTGKSPCHPNAVCTNNPSNPSTPNCVCKQGYSGDGRTACNEIDPCTSPNACPDHATCKKTGPGLKTCTCQTGYTGDGNTLCSEVNTCDISNPCHPKATCKKTGPGTVSCTCVAPYQGTGYSCTMTDFCASTPCDPRATCTNTGTGSYTCNCPVGYTTTNNGKTCDAMNACTQSGKSPCDVNANCISTGPNAFKCTCKQGYNGDGVSNCAEIDLCVSSNPCSANAQCTKSGPGKATCKCLNGYSGDGIVCNEVNICTTANPCDKTNAVCTRTGPGTASCQCKSGFSGDGHTCTAINGCDSSPCDVHATCTQTSPGGYRCDCNPGWEGSGLSDPLNNGCREKDPCLLAPCSTHANCKKLTGLKAECTCHTGYETKDSGKTCTPINNCVSLKPCDVNADCTVTGPGTHSCTCKTGYAWNFDGTVCLEINVCVSAPPCNPNALCTKTGPGKFTCACNPGYEGNGITCTEQNPCLPKSPCDPDHGTCTKTGPGKFKCSCDAGYEGTDVCTEIDPCRQTPRPCLGHATCHKTGPGVFQCTCDDGWKLVSADKCVEVNGCETNPCAFHAICHPQPGATFTCDCPPGFIGDGVNKCDPDPNAIDTTELDRLDYREKNFDQDVEAVGTELDRVEVKEDADHDAAQDYRLGDVKKIVSDVSGAANQLESTIAAQADTLRTLSS